MTVRVNALAAVGCIAVAVPQLAAAGRPYSEREERITRAASRLTLLASEHRGRGYACVLVPGINSNPRGVRLLVTSRGALPEARRLVRRARAERFTTLGVVDRRYSARAMGAVERRLRQATGELSDPTAVAIVRATNDRARGCPPLRIVYRAPVDPAVLDWARRQQTRYWADRIELYEAPPGQPDPQ